MNDNGVQYDLQYDRLHNLISFNQHGGGALATFSYDGDGMRVVKTSSVKTIVYHYDNGGRVISETDNNGILISEFVYANGKLVAKVASGARYFYHTDPAGTPLAMTDSSGSVVWRGDYLPFGEENLATGTLENDYRFVGKENDKETGLYYFGARYMEAMIGRFMSPDPVGAVETRAGKINQVIIHDSQRINLYAYALNNPYKYIDSTGEFAQFVLAIPLAKQAFVAFAAGATVFLNSPAGQQLRNEISRSLESIGDALFASKTGKDVKENTEKKGTRPGDLPAQGKPNSTDAKDYGEGKGQIRDYGPDGRAKTDYDFGHDHRVTGDPHAHDWDWSKKQKGENPRQPPRPLKPGE